MKLTRAEYDEARLNFTKRVLAIAEDKYIELFGKAPDPRARLDFIFRGADYAAKMWEEGAQAVGGIEVDGPEPDPDVLLEKITALLTGAPEGEK